MKIEISTFMARLIQKYLAEEVNFERKHQTNCEVRDAVISECEALREQIAKKGIEKFEVKE